MGLSVRHTRMSGWIPMLSSSFTECWVGLLFSSPAAGDGHDRRHMDVQHVLLALLRRHLPDGLQKGLALDVAHRAAYFGDDHIRLPVVHGIDTVFDLICDVRDDLHRAAQIASLPLPVQYAPVDFPGGDGGVGVQRLVHEPLIVAQIQIRLRPVIGDEHLPRADRGSWCRDAR